MAKATARRHRENSRSQGTRQRILDSAERLFAERGFHGVSIRDITGDAGVDVALANYHFGSKQGLLEAVFTRRAEVLNDARLERLEEVTSRRDRHPTLEEIIDAFTHPLRTARGHLPAGQHARGEHVVAGIRELPHRRWPCSPARRGRRDVGARGSCADQRLP